MLRVELGGITGKGNATTYVLEFQDSNASHVVDFENDPLPFDDNSVEYLNANDVFTRVDYLKLLHEIVRVCSVGAKVDFWAPHYLSPWALSVGRRHTVTPEQVNHWVESHIDSYWDGCDKRLSQPPEKEETKMKPSREYDRIRSIFSFVPDEVVIGMIPGACDEVHFSLIVKPHKSKEGPVSSISVPINNPMPENPKVSMVSILYRTDPDVEIPILQAAINSFRVSELDFDLWIICNDSEMDLKIEGWLKDISHSVGSNVVCDGHNRHYGDAINEVVKRSKGTDVFVYVDSRHGLCFDQSWVLDMIEPLKDQKVGMTGTVSPCEFNRVAAVPSDIIEPQIHVQGGLWAARRDVLVQVPYSSHFPQIFSDIEISRLLLLAGYELRDVPTVKSVTMAKVPNPQNFKYVRDYSGEGKGRTS